MTVEAALILPLFFFLFTALIRLTDLYGQYTEKLVDLQVKAELAGKAAGLTGLEVPVIDLREQVQYLVQGIPGAEIPVGIACRARVKSWIGRSVEDSRSIGAAACEDMVYVTPNREAVHLYADCSHLFLERRAVPAGAVGAYRNADGQRYRACEKCGGDHSEVSIVYIGPKGEAYHTDPDCGFKRTVELVRQSEAAGIPVCSRCRMAGEKS